MRTATAPSGARVEIGPCPWCREPWSGHDAKQRRACAAQPFTEAA